MNAATSCCCCYCMLQVWDKYLSVVGGGDSLSQDKFIECMSKLVHDASLKPTLEGPLPLFFHAVDANDDHLINGEEFKQFFDVRMIDSTLYDVTNKLFSSNHIITQGYSYFHSPPDKAR